MAHKRVDAVRIENVDGLHNAFCYVMPNRTESEACLTVEFDITELNKWLKDTNDSEGTNLKLFHAICTAVGKTIYHRPYLNRFIAGRHYWQRNDITLSFVAKRQFADGAEESLMVMRVKDDQTIDDVSKKILGDVKTMRKEGSHGVDDLLNALNKLPRFVLEIIFWAVRKMEYYGITPKALMEGDSNYCTVLLSNLGSIGGGAPYHHLNNYGTNSIMIVIGTMFNKQNEQGEWRTLVPMAITMDERIADGFYFTRSLKYIEWLLLHPEELRKPISELGDYNFGDGGKK